MKLRYIKLGIQILVLGVSLVTIFNAQGKSDTTKKDAMDKCRELPLGLYGQITNAQIDLAKGYYDPKIMKEADLKENRWTLDPLDEVDPTYRFLLLRSEAALERKCGDTIAVVGKLASPVGKLFEFREASYNFASRKLRFTTVEREGLVYEAEMQFYPAPVRVGGHYEEGTVKLTATGKELGTVKMEFKFMDMGIE